MLLLLRRTGSEIEEMKTVNWQKKPDLRTDRQTDGRLEERTDGNMDGRTNGRTDR